jgi:hypothetical protein
LTDDGCLFERDVARLVPWLPALAVADGTKITSASLYSYVTVETIAPLVEGKLATQ